MKSFNNTNNALLSVGDMLRKGLQDELKAQKHNATGRLSNSIKYNIKKRRESTLNVTSSVDYWRAVNNPKFAKTPNFREIQRWVQSKGMPLSSAVPVFRKLKSHYGKPYVYWTEGNKLRRTNFAGYVANKFKDRVADKLAPAIGDDVAAMMRKQVNKNTKAS